MDRGQWRDTPNLSKDSSKSLVISSSDDEVPGSCDISELESSNHTATMSRTAKPRRGKRVTPTIIDTTESEEEDEEDQNDSGSLNRNDESNESFESGLLKKIDNDRDKNQEISEDSDSGESIIRKSKRTQKKRFTRKAIIDDDSDENDGESSITLDRENNTDEADESFEGSKVQEISEDSESDESFIKMSKKTQKKRFTRKAIIEIDDDESSGENSKTLDDEDITGNEDNSALGNSLDSEEKNPEMEDSDAHIVHDNSDDYNNLKQSTVFNIEDSINEDNNSDREPLSVSDSSVPELAISLAKEEIPRDGIDPLVIQKRALDTFKLEQLKKDLLRAKTLYNTANREQLPDKGEKLRLSINNLEKDVERLSVELERTPTIENITLDSPISIKSEPSGISLRSISEFNLGTNIKTEKELGKKAQATLEKEQALTIERISNLQKSLNRCPEENERAEDPRGLKTKLMPHQQHALAWMLWREKEKPPGGLLADDMGLGKTLTMISLVVSTKDNSYSDSSATDDDEDEDEGWSNLRKIGRPKGGTLVVCPASLLEQWQNEVNNRCRRGILTVEIHHGARRENVPKRLARNDMVITTYQLVSSEFKKNSALFKIRWKRIILDEAHVIRNHTSKISEAVCKLKARNRWALTGTPVQNKEQDLYALLKFLRVTPFNDLQVWKRWVDNKNATGLMRLATVTKTLMLRRTKQELVAKGTLEELPEKFITFIPVDLDKEESKIYQMVLAFSQKLFAQFLTQRAEKLHMIDMNAGKFDKPAFMAKIPESHFNAAQKQLLGRTGEDVKSHHILVLILRLRQICCHAGLIKEMLNQEEAETNGIVPEEEDVDDDLVSKVNNMTLLEDEENEPESEENLFSLKNPVFDFDRKSSKIKAVLKTVREILEKGEKIIIVSQWTGMLAVLATHLSTIRGATNEMFSGSIPIKKRQGIVDRFNDPEDNLMILLLSLTAGGVGLNLVGGNHLLLIDIHWNPQLESQAQDRIYRFGQKKNVHVYKFLCNETIEQRVKELQDKKLNLAEDIFTGHRRTSSKLSLDDMKNIFEM